MKFRTEYKPEPSKFILSTEKTVVFAGSCFSQNICQKMNQHGWNAVNPFGTLYNPISILIALDMMKDSQSGATRFDKSLFHFNGLWHSHFFDTSFSSITREDCIEEFLIRQKQFLDSLSEGKTLCVTFGTSICYFQKESDKPVGKFHKIPSEKFYRRRLEIPEIVNPWNEYIERLTQEFPEIKFIFTVSPVRHLKDGFRGNARSKAVLLLALEEICKKENCEYFPAFEILNDDLRDYRFYACDLCHPSEEAVDYIWEIFKDTFVADEGRERLSEGLKRYNAASHRPHCGALGKPLAL